MFDIDMNYPLDHPGNQLRTKANGIPTEATPNSLAEVLHTASRFDLIPFRLNPDEAMTIAHMVRVAEAIDQMPGDEVERIKS